jgi:hypothetical protein
VACLWPFAPTTACPSPVQCSRCGGSGSSRDRTYQAGPSTAERPLRVHAPHAQNETTPPDANGMQQQERFDAFLREFNAECPHEALDMHCPAECYTASTGAVPACQNCPRRPVRHEVVTHVLGTTCYRCLRAGHIERLAEREELGSNLLHTTRRSESGCRSGPAAHLILAPPQGLQEANGLPGPLGTLCPAFSS